MHTRENILSGINTTFICRIHAGPNKCRDVARVSGIKGFLIAIANLSNSTPLHRHESVCMRVHVCVLASRITFKRRERACAREYNINHNYEVYLRLIGLLTRKSFLYHGTTPTRRPRLRCVCVSMCEKRRLNNSTDRVLRALTQTHTGEEHFLFRLFTITDIRISFLFFISPICEYVITTLRCSGSVGPRSSLWRLRHHQLGSTCSQMIHACTMAHCERSRCGRCQWPEKNRSHWRKGCWLCIWKRKKTLHTQHQRTALHVFEYNLIMCMCGTRTSVYGNSAHTCMCELFVYMCRATCFTRCACIEYEKRRTSLVLNASEYV